MQQKVYLDKNNIGSCIINLINLMKHDSKNIIPAIILLFDFQQAFDNLSYLFINNTLSLFDFGKNVLNWISTFVSSRESCILMRGNLSDRIFLKKVPQADIISPIIFILVVESLLIEINLTKNIKGMVFAKRES